MAAKRILVVDDEAMVLESVRMTLTHFGYLVETANTGDEALSKLAAGEFGLVVTDRRMPGMTGDQLATKIKEKWRGMPIVLLTGYPPDVRPPDVDAILLKPFSTQELRNTIRKLLKAEDGSG